MRHSLLGNDALKLFWYFFLHTWHLIFHLKLLFDPAFSLAAEYIIIIIIFFFLVKLVITEERHNYSIIIDSHNVCKNWNIFSQKLSRLVCFDDCFFVLIIISFNDFGHDGNYRKLSHNLCKKCKYFLHKYLQWSTKIVKQIVLFCLDDHVFLLLLLLKIPFIISVAVRLVFIYHKPKTNNTVSLFFLMLLIWTILPFGKMVAYFYEFVSDSYVFKWPA